MDMVIIGALVIASIGLIVRGNNYKKLYLEKQAEEESKAAMAPYKIEPAEGQAGRTGQAEERI